MSNASTPAVIRDNPAENRFETEIEGHIAKVDYILNGNTISFEHTTVPDALQGRGLGGQLVQACLASARERGLSVTPVCPVFVGYMKKRPETHDLLSPAGKKAIA
ncbi:MAG: GNAT family N-acetyltransferase [Burkholderiaceae bacterium]|nr:GNAT family N-acetyltransferase [Burkholderiaceae bacterium]